MNSCPRGDRLSLILIRKILAIRSFSLASLRKVLQKENASVIPLRTGKYQHQPFHVSRSRQTNKGRCWQRYRGAEFDPKRNVNAQEAEPATETKCLQEISTHSIFCNLENRLAWKILLHIVKWRERVTLMKTFFPTTCGNSRHKLALCWYADKFIHFIGMTQTCDFQTAFVSWFGLDGYSVGFE